MDINPFYYPVFKNNLLILLLVYPTNPSSIKTDQTNTTITVAWEPPQLSGSLPINYTLQCLSPLEICESSSTTQHPKWTPNLAYNLTGLLPYTAYEFQLCANNEVSLSNLENGQCEKFNARTKSGGALILFLFVTFQVRKQRGFDAHTTSFQRYGRCINVKTTLCAYSKIFLLGSAQYKTLAKISCWIYLKLAV